MISRAIRRSPPDQGCTRYRADSRLKDSIAHKHKRPGVIRAFPCITFPKSGLATLPKKLFRCPERNQAGTDQQHGRGLRSGRRCEARAETGEAILNGDSACLIRNRICLDFENSGALIRVDVGRTCVEIEADYVAVCAPIYSGGRYA